MTSTQNCHSAVVIANRSRETI